MVKEYSAKQWLPYGEPFAKAKSIRDTSHIKLKEHRVQMIASSWKPNYEAVETAVQDSIQKQMVIGTLIPDLSINVFGVNS